MTLAGYDDSIPLRKDDDARDEKWIEHLNAVHAIEFSLLNAAVQVGGIAAPIVLAVISNLPQNCSETTKSACIGDAQLAAVPMAPTLLVLFFGYLFFNSRIVGKYARNLERQIQGPEHLTEGITLPALARLSGAVFGGESRKLAPLRAFYLFLALAVVALSLYSMALAIIRIDSLAVKGAAIAFYSGVAVLATVAYGLGASHRLYARLATAAGSRDVMRSLPASPTLSWGRFMLRVLLPRVPSLLKAHHGVTILAIYLVLYYSSGVTRNQPHGYLRIIFGVMLFEVVLYQTRYLLNGSREQQDPQFSLPANRRNDPEVPFSPVQRVLIPIISLVRFGLFISLMAIWGVSSARFATSVVVLFVIAFYLYEIPREAARRALRTSVIRLEQHHPPADADASLVRATSEWASRGWVLFLAVGAGYALRAGVLLSLAPGNEGSLSAAGWLLVGVGWSTGSAIAAAGWTTEFLGAVSKGPRPALHRNILAKPHLLWAASHLEEVVPRRPWQLRLFSKEESREDDTFKVSEHVRYPQWTPWRIAICLAVALALGAAAIWPNRTSHDWSVIIYVVILIYLLMPNRGAGPVLLSKPTAAVVIGGCVLGSLGNSPLFILGVTAAVIYPLFNLTGSETGRLSRLIAQAEAVQKWLEALGPRAFKGFGVLMEFLVGYAVAHPRGGVPLDSEGSANITSIGRNGATHRPTEGPS